jgi:Fe-S-cluster containining protein
MQPDASFREHVMQAARRPEVADAIRQLYADVQQAIDARKPVCVMSGRCCRFEEFGHRLFVTTMEMGAFVAQQPSASLEAWDGTGCVFQKNKLCSVHTVRPFGCRMFFCDATSTEWQNEQYELFHSRIKSLHQSLGVPYFYVEWRAALRTVFDRSHPNSLTSGT